MSTQHTQPEALRLADEFERPYWDNGEPHGQLVKAAAELRRLHALNGELLGALERIANGPWPDELNSPEDQCRFDEHIARAAIAKATSAQG